MERSLHNFASGISDFLPNLIGALLLLLIGWLIAKGIRSLIISMLRKTTWDERVFGASTTGDTNVFIANIFYYIIMVIVLLVVLEILGLREVLVPLGNMVDKFLSFIPNLVGAALIAFIGYVLAKFVSNLIRIGGGFLDRLVDKTGFQDTARLIDIVRKFVFLIIFIPFLIQAFNALQLEAISEPANNILYRFTELLGEIVIAGLILFVFIWGGRFLANFLEDLFRSMGLDTAAEKIRIHTMIGPNQSLSKILANILYFFLVFFGVITAVEIVGLDRLAGILHQLLEITGQILFGLVILAIGNFISLLIYHAMTRANEGSFIANVVRWASMALFIAIALRTMGIANEIVELAFGLILGAIAVAVALSYGLGGREAAGEHFRDIVRKFRNDANSGGNHPNPPTPPRQGDRPGPSGNPGNMPPAGPGDPPVQ